MWDGSDDWSSRCTPGPSIGGGDRGDDVGATALADVRHALNQRHGPLVSQVVLPHNRGSRISANDVLSLICPIRSAQSSTPEPARALDDGDAERDAKIESLLLGGLDHYFASDYAQAIDVWTRALFLDRQHARARAYIERARSALAEEQRESEELLHNGVAAFERGEIEAARQLLNAAVQRGGAHEVALAFLTRIDRISAASSAVAGASGRTRQAAAPARARACLLRRAAGVAWRCGEHPVAGGGAGGRRAWFWRPGIDVTAAIARSQLRRRDRPHAGQVG